ADRAARKTLRARAHARGRAAPRAAHADAAHARRRGGAGRQGVSPLAHPERSRRRLARGQPRGLPEPGARRRARLPDAHCDPRSHRPQLRSARISRDGPVSGVMKGKPNYFWAAFNARPLGMPVPPNWFGLAAFGLLGALINPGLWLVGLGLEGLYLWAIGRNARFRNTIDAAAGFSDSTTRYEDLLAHLDSNTQSRQYEVERAAAEL